ncbi:TVP38/TMEM64 family protein [Phormidesmis priestleyi]
MQNHSRLKKAFLAIFLFALTYIGMAIVLQKIGLENAHVFIKNSGIWAPVIFVVVCASTLIVAPLSGSSFFVAGGVLFDKNSAFFLSFFASIIGCSINFWISRTFGRRIAERLVGKTDLEQLDRFIDRLSAHRSIFYIILLMPLSQDIVSYAVGLTRVNYWRFLVALIVSAIAVVAAYVYLGSSLLEFFIQR